MANWGGTGAFIVSANKRSAARKILSLIKVPPPEVGWFQFVSS